MSAKTEKTSAKKPWYARKYSFRSMNILFSFLLIFGIVSLIVDLQDAPELERIIAAAESANPWLAFAILLPTTLLISLLFSIGTKLDRRCSEDYAFQVMATAALAALPTVLFAHLVWQILAKMNLGAPMPMGSDMVSLMLISWAAAWFTLSIKGLR